MQKANCGSVGWNGAETGRLEPSLFPAPGVCIRFQTKGSQWVRAAQESRNGKAGAARPGVFRAKTHLFMELTDPETELDGVQTGVWNGQSGVGNVHILERKSGVIAAIAEWKVHSDAQLWREIDRVRAEWDIVIGDKDASTELGKGD